MKLLIVNNLTSGYGEGAVYDFVRSIVRDGDETVIRSTDGTTEVDSLLADATAFDAVVAAGGDGTVASAAYRLANTGVPLLVFPAGTANLLASNLLLPNEPHALAKLVRDPELMDFDMGEITLSDGSRHGFSIMAGAGYDADIMAGAADTKKLLGAMAYFTTAFTHTNPTYAKFRLLIDGKMVESEGVGVLIVNFSKIQFDLSVVHENSPRDGLFDVVVLRTKDAFGLIPALISSFLDRGGEYPHRGDAFEIHRGSTVEVEADPPLPVQFDGEVCARTTPFAVTMLPGAARFIVSEDTKDYFAL